MAEWAAWLWSVTRGLLGGTESKASETSAQSLTLTEPKTAKLSTCLPSRAGARETPISTCDSLASFPHLPEAGMVLRSRGDTQSVGGL